MVGVVDLVIVLVKSNITKAAIEAAKSNVGSPNPPPFPISRGESMAYGKQSYLEHVAIRVKDIHWHIRFFREVLGMTLREVQGPPDAPTQVWTIGGVQLISDPSFDGPEGRLAHLGIMTEDLEAVLQEAEGQGIGHFPQGRNWLALPDGICVEVIQASASAVSQALTINPRA